jgi:ParB-like nuclease domain
MIDISLIGMLWLDETSLVRMHDVTIAMIGHPEGMTIYELAEDVRERGILEPVIVGPGWMIDGRHRYLGAVLAGLEEIPYEVDQGRRERRAVRPVSSWQDPRGIPVVGDWI